MSDVVNGSKAVSGYVGAIRGVACEILDLISLSLSITSPSLGGVITASGNDSVLRINFYPPTAAEGEAAKAEDGGGGEVGVGLGLGFGEHSDPQVLTVLRSNDVGGLQVWVREEGEGEAVGWWTAVPPDPTAFWVNVGDLLQVFLSRLLLLLIVSSVPFGYVFSFPCCLIFCYLLHTLN